MLTPAKIAFGTKLKTKLPSQDVCVQGAFKHLTD